MVNERLPRIMKLRLVEIVKYHWIILNIVPSMFCS